MLPKAYAVFVPAFVKLCEVDFFGCTTIFCVGGRACDSAPFRWRGLGRRDAGVVVWQGALVTVAGDAACEMLLGALQREMANDL